MSHESRHGSRTQLAAGTILICEDVTALDEDMFRILKTLGSEVAGTVSTGDDAVGRAEEAKAGLILMDILLARRSGLHG